jgi:cytochrome c-type biogenesis protein CcmH/NrfF
MRGKLLRLTGIGLLALLTLGADVDRRRFEKLGHEMVCTCGCNQILLECNHVGCPASDGMRNELTAAMQKAGDDGAVLQTFVAKYGPTVLAAPTTTGFSRVAWIMPFAIFLAGLGLAMLVIRNWRLRPAEVVPANDAMAERFRSRAREETRL